MGNDPLAKCACNLNECLERLEELKRILTAVSKHETDWRLDMRKWIGNFNVVQGKIIHGCNTSACAWDSYLLAHPDVIENGVYGSIVNLRDGDIGLSTSYCSIAEFFGISVDDAEDIFNPEYYPKGNIFAYHVIDRIDAVIDKMKIATLTHPLSPAVL